MTQLLRTLGLTAVAVPFDSNPRPRHRRHTDARCKALRKALHHDLQCQKWHRRADREERVRRCGGAEARAGCADGHGGRSEEEMDILQTPLTRNVLQLRLLLDSFIHATAPSTGGCFGGCPGASFPFGGLLEFLPPLAEACYCQSLLSSESARLYYSTKGTRGGWWRA